MKDLPLGQAAVRRMDGGDDRLVLSWVRPAKKCVTPYAMVSFDRDGRIAAPSNRVALGKSSLGRRMAPNLSVLGAALSVTIYPRPRGVMPHRQKVLPGASAECGATDQTGGCRANTGVRSRNTR